VGGPQDRTYAIWGKPVEKTLLDYFSLPIFEGHIPPKQSDIQTAVIESLVAQKRKERDYADGQIAPWADQWMKEHPLDRQAVQEIVDREPVPKKKIPKGRER
jgi:hypothetical protein